MIDEGQIDPLVARKIIEDLFEPGTSETARLVRPAVWRAYLKDRTGHIGPYLVGSSAAEPDAPKH